MSQNQMDPNTVRQKIRDIRDQFNLVKSEPITFEKLRTTTLGANTTLAMRETLESMYSDAGRKLHNYHCSIRICIQDLQDLKQRKYKHLEMDEYNCNQLLQKIATKRNEIETWRNSLRRTLYKSEYEQIREDIRKNFNGNFEAYLKARIEQFEPHRDGQSQARSSQTPNYQTSARQQPPPPQQMPGPSGSREQQQSNSSRGGQGGSSQGAPYGRSG